MLLRNAGTPPVMAQAPIATSTLQCLRNSSSTWTFSALLTPPSTMPMSHGPQCLVSVNGVRSNSIIPNRSNSFSSISSKDIWQPKQPASEQVATRIFRFSFMVRLHLFHWSHLHFADFLMIECALAYGYLGALAFDQNRAGRADMSSLVGHSEIGIAQSAAGRIYHQTRTNTAPGDTEYVLAVNLTAGADA